MQIMEGDLIDTIRKNIRWLGHFHTGGVPGRHELDGTQEVQWDGVMRAIADSGFKGYVAHEFVPTGDQLGSLRKAVGICDEFIRNTMITLATIARVSIRIWVNWLFCPMHIV